MTRRCPASTQLQSITSSGLVRGRHHLGTDDAQFVPVWWTARRSPGPPVSSSLRGHDDVASGPGTSTGATPQVTTAKGFVAGVSDVATAAGGHGHSHIGPR